MNSKWKHIMHAFTNTIYQHDFLQLIEIFHIVESKLNDVDFKNIFIF
jgi:hypothetical protein